MKGKRNVLYWDTSAFTGSAHIKRFGQAVTRRIKEKKLKSMNSNSVHE